jgi:hypothetical protein
VKRTLAVGATIVLLMTLLHVMPAGSGVVNIDAGPYTANMYFSELPRPWWEGTWWDMDWHSRQKLSFDAQSISEDLSDFPVLISLDSGRIDYTGTQDAGEDIRFVDSDDATVLDYEIEIWNESGSSIVWVKVPLIDGGSMTDHIWMYYNNTLASDAQNPAGVWGNGYVGVWHLDEDPSGPSPQIDDSTSNANQGTTAGTMTSVSSVDAKIGKGLRLDGMDDMIIVQDSQSLDTVNDEGTLEIWLNWTDSSDGDHQIVMTSSNRFTPGANDGYEWGSQGDGDHFFYPWGGDVDNYNLGLNPFTDGMWHHVMVTFDFSTKESRILVDNAPMTFTISNVDTLWTNLSSSNDWLWGGNPDRATRYFDGSFDEIRVSDIVRSNDWMTAQYMSMTDSFVAYGGTDSGYSYRRNVVVEAGPENIPAGHSVSVTFDHASLVLEGKAQIDGDDIRIVHWNATHWEEMDLTLDPDSSWNDNATTIWFTLRRRIDALSSDINYYLYYGNPSVTSPPTGTQSGRGVKSVQSGIVTNSINGVTTVPISQVNMTKAFLIFNARHDNGRPVGSEIRGRIATPTTLEFARVTDEAVPTPITVQWYVVEYQSGVRVQRGQIGAQSSTAINAAINPVANLSQAFVTWSKTPTNVDVNWSSDDPTIGELTSNSNLQFRVFGANSGHVIWWQVVEFTNPNDIGVQKGSAPPMIGTDLSVNVTLPNPVDMNRTFVLVSFATEGSGPDIGARMLRAQLVNATTITIDRSISGAMDNITEISWQAVELKDGSMAWGGSENLGSGVLQKSVPLVAPVDVNRSIAFASVQPASGQSMGRSPYVGDDILGVGSVTMALSPTEIVMERSTAVDETDIGWFVVEFWKDDVNTTVGAEESEGNVQIRVSVYHVDVDGTDPQEIVTSPVVTIDSSTPYPFALNIGNGPQLNFTDSNPRLLRLGINVVDVMGGEHFTLNYNYSAQRSNLEVPSSPQTIYYLHNMDIVGVAPSGKVMMPASGVGGATMDFDMPGQEAYWYAPLYSMIDITLLSPLQNEHITGTYNAQYTVSGNATSVSFEYLDGLSWTPIGSDPNLDGNFAFDACQIGDRVTDLKAIARNSFNDIAESIVTGIEIDCTPPAIQIIQPTEYSEIEGDMTIQYITDSDAVTAEFRYDDGQLHTIAMETPPDGILTWSIGNQTLKGVTLRAIATDEVGLSSSTQVLGLSTPEPITPGNKPPTISGVPDIIVHYDYSYNFDLTPYVEDEDTSFHQLVIWTSDSQHIWTSPTNNLGLVMNYPQSMLGQTVQVTIWVTDGTSSDFQVVNITILDDYPPEKVNPLPDVSFDEDETVLNVFFTSLNYYFQDIDDNNLYFTSGNKSVRIRINVNDTVDMWAKQDWFGFEIITIRATDPTGALVEDVVIVQVNPVNDAPVIDPIPDIAVEARHTQIVDLMPYIHDIDTPMDSLVVSVNGQHTSIDRFNLSLTYPIGINQDQLTITVFDGLENTTGTIRILVQDDVDHCLLLLVLIVAMLVNFLAWGVYLTLKPKLYGGYLLREDGSLIREISFTRKELIPFGFIRNHVKSKGMSDAIGMNLKKYRVTFVHGESLHFAAISSVKLFEDTLASMKGALTELEEADFDGFPNEESDDANRTVLDEFEFKLKKMRFWT